MIELRLYELINPSDKITFRASIADAAVIADVLAPAMMFVEDIETGLTPKIEDVPTERDTIFKNPERRAAYADAFGSFMIGTPTDRKLFVSAVKNMTAEQADSYRMEWHDARRTSMSDHCQAMWDIAKGIRSHGVEGISQ